MAEPISYLSVWSVLRFINTARVSKGHAYTSCHMSLTTPLVVNGENCVIAIMFLLAMELLHVIRERLEVPIPFILNGLGQAQHVLSSG